MNENILKDLMLIGFNPDHIQNKGVAINEKETHLNHLSFLFISFFLRRIKKSF